MRILLILQNCFALVIIYFYISIIFHQPPSPSSRFTLPALRVRQVELELA